MSNFQLGKNSTSFLKYILCILYIYTHTHMHKSFSTTVDKGVRKHEKKKKTDGEIGKHKPNEMRAL